MSWGYRRSKRIAPGVRFNVGKRGVGTSFGPRHAKLSVNTSGRRSLYLSLFGFFFRKRLKPPSAALRCAHGGVPERSNGAVLKAADRRKAVRGFKSHPRR